MNMQPPRRPPVEVKNDVLITAFLSGTGKDLQGRTYASMIATNDEDMEQCHDQIQWLFPLHEASKMAIHSYPLITPEYIDWLMGQPKSVITAIRLHLIRGLDRMLNFYMTTHPNWLHPKNHNMLRITRIIRSLRLFGLEKEAIEFYGVMVGYIMAATNNNPINYGIALLCWTKAAFDNIWSPIRP
jgi:hypothetical protein